jgi:hypothetical protein
VHPQPTAPQTHSPVPVWTAAHISAASARPTQARTAVLLVFRCSCATHGPRTPWRQAITPPCAEQRRDGRPSRRDIVRAICCRLDLVCEPSCPRGVQRKSLVDLNYHAPARSTAPPPHPQCFQCYAACGSSPADRSPVAAHHQQPRANECKARVRLDGSAYLAVSARPRQAHTTVPRCCRGGLVRQAVAALWKRSAASKRSHCCPVAAERSIATGLALTDASERWPFSEIEPLMRSDWGNFDWGNFQERPNRG